MPASPSPRDRCSVEPIVPGTQLALALALPAPGDKRVRRGGPRPGAGRPATGRTRVAHRRRPALAHRHPVHVTLRAVRGLPSFRSPLVCRLFARVFREVSKLGFGVAHYSVQADHVHLVVEAQDRQRLSSGVRRLVIRAARRLNLLLGRGAGRVWAERYHRHDLRTPREVRNALVYVLTNAKKHGALGADAGHDPCSSALYFDGWSAAPPHADPTGPPPVTVPRTWLLRIGWRRHGLIADTSAPASLRSRRRRGRRTTP